MNLSPETLKFIIIVIQAIVALIGSVVCYYVITFIKRNKKEKLLTNRRNATYHHRHDAMYFAISTYNNGFDPAKFDPVYDRKLKELMDNDDIFKD